MEIRLFFFLLWPVANKYLIRSMFKILNTPLQVSDLKQTLHNHQAGACITFEGWVRDINEGKKVLRLEYEAYAQLAEKEGTKILAEARERYCIINTLACHRVGLLDLGELAVWVGVVAEHRGSAFDACRYIIDETKARVPIWKREHYCDGVRAWINCANRGDHKNVTR